MNRKNGENDDAVYTIKEGWDQNWLDTTLEYNPEWDFSILSIDEFLLDVCEKENYPKILFDKYSQHEIIPQIITIAGTAWHARYIGDEVAIAKEEYCAGRFCAGGLPQHSI